MESNDPFKRAEDQYFILRGKLEIGRITREQFQAALHELMIEDTQGQHWTIGVDSGKWHVHDQGTWVEANPYGAAQAQSAPSRPITLPGQQMPSVGPVAAPPTLSKAKQGRSCVSIVLTGFLVFTVLVVILGVGGFVAVQNGWITLNTLLNLAGLGPGDSEVDNFRDEAIDVTVRQLDPPQGSSPAQGRLVLNAFDVKSYRAQNPGIYRVEFRTGRGTIDLGACNLRIRSGDQYQFVVLPERIVVNRVNNPSAVGTDFVIQTSALCR